MGTWTIRVKGHGQHHNGSPTDADVIARDFVNALKVAGHDVSSAQLVLTGQNQDGSESEGEVTDLIAAAPTDPAPTAP